MYPHNEGKFESVLKKIRSTDTNIFPCVLSLSKGQFTHSFLRTRFFQDKRFLVILWSFVEGKENFARGVRDFVEVKCRSFQNKRIFTDSWYTFVKNALRL